MRSDHDEYKRGMKQENDYLGAENFRLKNQIAEKQQEIEKLRSSICATDLLDKAAECGARIAFKMVAERYGDDITEDEWMAKWWQRREEIKSLTYNSPSFNKKVHR